MVNVADAKAYRRSAVGFIERKRISDYYSMRGRRGAMATVTLNKFIYRFCAGS